jgi:hypothetical protein
MSAPEEFPDELLDAAMETFLGGAREQMAASRQILPGRRRGRGEAPETIAIREFIGDRLVPQFDRMTVCQIFYAVEVAGLVPKTEGGYSKVQKLCAKMRRQDDLAWRFVADGTRWVRMRAQWDDAADFIEDVRKSYRRTLWRDQRVRIGVWLEKDALAEVIYETTDKWRVPLMVSRGESSLTFLHGAAMEAKAAYRRDGTETWIYALYDYDAGGDRAARTIARDLPEMSGVPIHFERLAVTPTQVGAWNLPTRPPKTKDPEATAWNAKSLAEIGQVGAVELDAIPPNQLLQTVKAAITRNINWRRWEVQQAIEAKEREGLEALRLENN